MKRRILLVSDMHFTTNLSEAELKKTHPKAIASAASGTAFGLTQEEKLEKMLSDILREHEKAPLDEIWVLGDLSIDDANFRNLPDNYCLKFRDEYMARFPAPAHVIPGNHDSHSNEAWQKIFGRPRQFTLESEGLTAIFLDTFAQVPAASASGSPYTGIDEDYLENALQNAGKAPIILCAHMFRENSLSSRAQALLQDERIICLFRGHTHHNETLSCAGKPLIDIGGYAYEGMKTEAGYTFQVFSPRWAWGYEIMEYEDGLFTVSHVQTDMHYTAQNGEFDLPFETVETRQFSYKEEK